MSYKGKRQNGDYFDTANGYVFAEHAVPLPENIKTQIETVKETFPSKSKDDIALVLQMCDYSLESALTCLAQDGGEDILKDWNTQGKKGKNGFISNKNKKKKRANKKARNNQQQVNIQNDLHPEEAESIVSETPGTEEELSQASEKDFGSVNGDARVLFNNIESHSQCSSRKSSISYVSTSEAPETPLALSSSSNPSLSANDKTFPKVYPDESLSSDTRSSALNSENLEKQRHDAKKKFSAKEGMKRSVKDLQRSAASIARFHLVLEEGCEAAEKQLKKSFAEIKTCVAKRETLLIDELTKLKTDAAELLNNRQEDAAVLKLRCDRIGGMTEHELSELRADIKHFISDRKTDEEIAKATKFIEDRELVIQAIERFAHVPPLKALYRQRSTVSLSDEQRTNTASVIANDPIKPVEKISPDRNKAKTDSAENNSGKEIFSQKPLSSIELKEQAATHNRLKQALQQQGLTDTRGPRHKNKSDSERQRERPHDNHSSGLGTEDNQAAEKKQIQAHARSFRRHDRRKFGNNRYNSREEKPMTATGDHRKPDGQFAKDEARRFPQARDIKTTADSNSNNRISHVQDKKPHENRVAVDVAYKPSVQWRHPEANVNISGTSSGGTDVSKQHPSRSHGTSSAGTDVSKQHPFKANQQVHVDVNGNTVDQVKRTASTTEEHLPKQISEDVLPQRRPNNYRRRYNRDGPRGKVHSGGDREKHLIANGHSQPLDAQPSAKKEPPA